MIISNINGGLGNQMFQYAIAKSLSLKYNTPFILDTSIYQEKQQHQGYLLNKVFKISPPEATKGDLAGVVGFLSGYLLNSLRNKPKFRFLMRNSYVAQDIENLPMAELKKISKAIEYTRGDCYLNGYWQSEQYFYEQREVVARDFIFANELDSVNEQLARQMQSHNSVAVHVRRGDYVDTKTNRLSYAVCSPEYYKQALSEIEKRDVIDKVYFFSDDIDWVKKNIKSKYACEYISHNQNKYSYKDMQLMTFCRFHVVANSSFSWWGAWLANIWNSGKQIVIAPKYWGLKKPMPVQVTPKEWILI